ncbi:MAG: secretin N-terminal domain-containing protein [Puniceicoccaceae bacterium]
MKGQILIPLLSVLLVAPLTAQEAQMAALDRAEEAIASADAESQASQAEVMDAVDEPELPEEPVFEVPSDEVFLDLPGSDDEATAVAMDSETISVDFPEEDVRDIIRSVAELYELNVVIPDSLAGSVSIKLREVTWTQVFDVVLEPLNYTYIVDGNIIKIKSRDELAVEPVDTRVFIVDFAKAAEIRSSIEPLVDAASGGKIQVDVRSNALVITERPSRMNDIQEIIETLDRPTEQVMIESKFVEITGREGENLGIDWQSLEGWGVAMNSPQRVYTRNRGYDTETQLVTDQVTNEQYPLTYVEPINGIERFDSAVFSTDSFRVVLSALESNTDIELVSNPTVVTMNNSPARINIGEEYPIPAYTYNDERGTFEVSNFEYKNIGINMQVTPQINSAGFINLNIEPEISSRTGEVQFGGASGATIPIITTRKTLSTVTIKSGYTLAIGGLIEKVTGQGESKVPVLGDIPYLGRLFSSENNSTDRRNLIVFITAKILSASGATYEDVFSNSKLHEMGVSPSDVPGYEPSEAQRALTDEVMKSREDAEALMKELELREELQLLDSLKQRTEWNIEAQAEDQ